MPETGVWFAFVDAGPCPRCAADRTQVVHCRQAGSGVLPRLGEVVCPTAGCRAADQHRRLGAA